MDLVTHHGNNKTVNVIIDPNDYTAQQIKQEFSMAREGLEEGKHQQGYAPNVHRFMQFTCFK